MATAGVVAGLGGAALLAWLSGLGGATALRPGLIPVAPNTALLLLLLGASLVAVEVRPDASPTRAAAAVASVVSAILAAATLVQFLAARDWGIDGLLIAATGRLGQVPVGHMSPVTAAALLFAAVGLLCLVRTVRDAAGMLGMAAGALGWVALTGYAYGAPLLYGGTVVPVALPTAAALLILGVAEVTAAGPDAWPLRTFEGPTTRARLFRSVLPAVVVVMVISDWIGAATLGDASSGTVLASALTSVVALAAVGFVLDRVSRWIGGRIDAAESERERVQQMRSDFLSMASHELRTPLTVISGFAAMLTRSEVTDDPAKRAKAVGAIARRTAEMTELVEDLLSVSRMQTGGLDLEPETVQVEDLAALCTRRVPDDQRDRVEVVIAAQRSPAFCDPQRISYAVSNLLSNALKFSPADSKVTLEVGCDGRVLSLAVTDQGVGISARELDRIFERFTQGDMRGSTSLGGFGLGLYIARTIVEAHGGHISVRSGPSKGSTFAIEVPAGH